MGKELVLINQIKQKIAAAETLPELKPIIDQSAAAVQAAKMLKDEQTAVMVSQWLLRAIRKAARILDAAERSEGGRPEKTAATVAVVSEYARILEEAKVPDRTARRWQQILPVPDEVFEQYLRECEEKNNVARLNYVLSLAAEYRNNSTPKIGTVTITKTDASTLLKELEDSTIDLLLTDPPYSTDVDDIWSFVDWLDPIFYKLKPTGKAYIFTGAYPEEMCAYLTKLLKLSRSHGWKFDNVLVWTYRNTLGPTPASGYKLNWQSCFYLYGPDAGPIQCPSMSERFTVQDVNAPDARTGTRYHAWQKPDILAERLVLHGSEERDLICDPFCGTGTFVIAAEKLGRNVIASDNSDGMLEIVRRRRLHA